MLDDYIIYIPILVFVIVFTIVFSTFWILPERHARKRQKEYEESLEFKKCIRCNGKTILKLNGDPMCNSCSKEFKE